MCGYLRSTVVSLADVTAVAGIAPDFTSPNETKFCGLCHLIEFSTALRVVAREMRCICAGGGMADQQRTDPREEGQEGRYANYFNVGHNAFEVVLAFGQFYEGNVKPQLHTKIVTSPAYAKTFLELLRDSLEQYEKAYGAIPTGIPHE